MSRNRAASDQQLASPFEEKIYTLNDETNFNKQLFQEQNADPIIISIAIDQVANNQRILAGRLKRVQKQLRIENNVLTKSGRPVIPPSMRKFITCQIHGTGHLGTDKTYSFLKQQFY